MTDAIVLEQAPNLDRAFRGEPAIGIGEERNFVAQRLAHRRDDLLRAPRPFVDVMPALRADTELERVEPELVAQAAQTLGLCLRGNVALHRRRVGAEPPRPATEQLAYALALPLAAKVP